MPDPTFNECFDAIYDALFADVDLFAFVKEWIKDGPVTQRVFPALSIEDDGGGIERRVIGGSGGHDWMSQRYTITLVTKGMGEKNNDARESLNDFLFMVREVVKFNKFGLFQAPVQVEYIKGPGVSPGMWVAVVTLTGEVRLTRIKGG